MPLRTLLIALTATLLGTSAPACGVDEILSQTCDAHDIEMARFDDPGDDRALLYKKYAWSKHSEFKKLKTEDMVLRVCLFRGPSTTALKSNAPTMDFMNSAELFEDLGADVKKGAAIWENNKDFKKKFGSESRIRFDFRTSDNKIRSCEADGPAHILIALNRANVNKSAVGTSAIKKAYKTGTPRSTMFLSVTKSNAFPAHTIGHEFGHALGLVHEMAHKGWKACADAFDAQAFIDAGKANYGTKPDGSAYTNDEKLALVKKTISELSKHYKNNALDDQYAFDLGSIMTYKIEERFFDPDTKPGPCGVPRFITKLSDTDIQFLLSAYGR